ncbi:hypothetical protein AALA36_01530 [Lachnospiraceae bacterium 66-29]
MIIEKNTESELADYVSDDFGLIYDSFVLNYKDEWLEKVIAAYKNKKISTGVLYCKFKFGGKLKQIH